MDHRDRQYLVNGYLVLEWFDVTKSRDGQCPL